MLLIIEENLKEFKEKERINREKNKEESRIFKLFLNNMNNSYIENTSKKQIVIDFIAGMTDDYFISQLDSTVNNI